MKVICKKAGEKDIVLRKQTGNKATKVSTFFIHRGYTITIEGEGKPCK